jgi:transposase
MSKLREKELMCAEVLTDAGQSVRSTAQQLGVAESTLRYRLQRRRQEATDGRTRQREECAPYDAIIQAWIETQAQRDGRPDSVQSLYELLMSQHGFTGSYKAVWRYVRRRRPPPKRHPKRRVETRPGTQAQLDWATKRLYVAELGGWTALSAFLMSLSYSRMWSVQWSLDQSQLAWLACHNRAFQALAGIPWSVRIDNLKTAVAQGGGAWAVLNTSYTSYADQLGFVIDCCRLRQASDKGKVERRVGDVKSALIGAQERFDSLASLQQTTDTRIRERADRLRCPVTGQSIAQSWQEERLHLYPLPATWPTPFDVQVRRRVGADGLIAFEQRQYAVPFPFIGRTVDVRGCPQTVEIYGDNHLLITYPRQTQSRLLIDQACYEGEATERVECPTPLGKVGQAIVLSRSWEAPRRPMDTYTRLVDQAGRGSI